MKDIKIVSKVGLDHFVSSTTKKFFSRFGLKTDFLNAPPSTWEDNEDYKLNRNVVQKIRTVNDTAERGVKLIQEYCSSLTKNEEQRQFALQIVSDYRKRFPQAKKASLMEKY